MAVVVRGLGTLRWYAGFVVDPIATMLAAYRRHGDLLVLADPVPLVRSKKVTALAIGAAHNRTVLGDTALWRTAGLVLRGPRDSAQRRLRFGIVRMHGPQHAYYRSLLSRPLRRANIAAMNDTITATIAAEVERWPAGQAVDLFALVKHLMRGVSLRLLFGDDERELGLEVARMIERHLIQNGSPQVLGCPVDLPGTPYRAMLRHSEAVERCVIDWARLRQGRPDERDLLSVVVNAPDHLGAPPSDALIAGHVPTLFGATYETCQSALTWTLFLLAQHPRVAHALLDEITGALRGGPVTLAAVDGLALLEAVIKESMRVLTPVPFQIRSAVRPAEIGGLPVPSGARVILSGTLTNRLPEVYPEPKRFRPERWETLDPSPFEYLTFSAGPRLCIGYWFAMAVLKVAVASAVLRFRIAVAEGARIDRRVSVSMSPRPGIPVVLHKQDRGFAAAQVRGSVLDLVDLAQA